jgi:hypothetical protein
MAEVVQISPLRQKLRIAKENRRNSRRNFVKRYNALVDERQSWISHWRDISEVLLPRRIKLFYDTRQRGEKMNKKIINSTAGRSLRILSSGMMSGISSPARPWFRLITPWPEMMEVEEVRDWLHDVEEIMRTVFNRSNLYNVLALTYRDLGAWGVAAQCIEEDEQDVIRAYSYQPGSYVIQNNARGEVDVLYHELPMTVEQIAERFGFDNASDSLKSKWEENRLDDVIRILHVIEPNETYDSTQLGKAGKKYRSVWIELEGGSDDGPPLFEGNGYNEFLAQCPRWDASGNDIYGESPAMTALGDINALQQLEKRKLSAIDKITNPPMTAPESLERKKKSQLAGDVTYLEMTPGGQRFEPAYLVDPKIVFIREEIAGHERRIEQSFYVDLFLMLANMDQAQPITAREVDERHEEKMLQLGPVLERLHDELLTKVIDRTFEILVRRGLLPPPPPELQGLQLRVEFISILAQAQKLLGTVSVERLLSFVGNAVAVWPEAKDKIDIDKTIDDYSGMLGTNPEIVRGGDELKAIRDQRAQQEQMASMAAMAKPIADAAGAAQTLSQTDQQQPGSINNLVSTLAPNIPIGPQ